MISLICFILTLAGSVNWFCIGVLQYDFIAGIFGSQANVFSRIIYALIGLSSIWLVFALIKGKGKLKLDGKKSTDKQLLSSKKAAANIETSQDVNGRYNTEFNGFNNPPYNMGQNNNYNPNYNNSNYNNFNGNANFNNNYGQNGQNNLSNQNDMNYNTNDNNRNDNF